MLDAADRLFAENGAEATSISDVATRAGCSVGTVYHHFGDKKRLLHALVERYIGRFQITIDEVVAPPRWAGSGVRVILAGYVAFSLEAGQSRPAFARPGAETARSDSKVRLQLAGLHSELKDGFASLLLVRRKEIGHPNPILAIHFVLDQLAAVIIARQNPFLMPSTLIECPSETFVQEALEAAAAYLRLDE